MQATTLLSLCLAFATLVSVNAVPIAAPNLIGAELGVIDIASQNSAVNNGNVGVNVSHSLPGYSNTAQNIVVDAQSIDTLKNVDVLSVRLCNSSSFYLD
jgi:hypothetical protein